MTLSWLTVAASCAEETPVTEQIGVVVTILPPGASPHTYEPTPSKMAALAKARMDAKVSSGVKFELFWMDKLISVNKDMLVVGCSQDVQLQEMVVAH